MDIGAVLGALKEQGVCIIGAGFAGFGAAYNLREHNIASTIFEARSEHGGHTSTHFYNDGFMFDEGPHISFTSNKRLQNLFAESLGGDYENLIASVNNYWQGHYIKHPAQVNLHGLPVDLIVNCIDDFVTASKIEDPEINNYEDWLRASFGDCFSKTFPEVYTRKYHTTDAKNLTTDWLGPRLYRPELSEVLKGALLPKTPDIHYVSDFRYPTHGGFVAYLDGFRAASNIKCDHRVVKIDAKARRISFDNGQSEDYSHLISSVPLPRLIPMIDGVPKDVLDAAELLACTEVVLINIGVKRQDMPADHWTYFYDEDIVFTRLSYPSNFSPNVAPEGCFALQAEVYFSSKWKPRDAAPEAFIEPVIEGLLTSGIVKDRSEIVHSSAMFAPYANIIFDYDRPKCLEIVHAYLDDVDIGYCGRFGDWGYIWTDQAFNSGERAAERVVKRL